jgi:hypothetical protein
MGDPRGGADHPRCLIGLSLCPAPGRRAAQHPEPPDLILQSLMLPVLTFAPQQRRRWPGGRRQGSCEPSRVARIDHLPFAERDLSAYRGLSFGGMSGRDRVQIHQEAFRSKLQLRQRPLIRLVWTVRSHVGQRRPVLDALDALDAR